MERDNVFLHLDSCFLYFNSHAHVERDETLSLGVTDTTHFNSHAHVERDKIPDITKSLDTISTHTLTWSVTG